MEHNDRKAQWQQLSSEVVYDNPWIQVRHDTVITPAKTEGIYGVVHFKNHAVGIVPVDDDGHVYLVKQSRYISGQLSLEIPEGGCPEAEHPLAAAKRELKEETGLSAQHWEPWLTMDLSNSVTDEQATIFLAQGLTAGESQLEETEDIEVCRLPFQEAINHVLAGTITDAMSVAALLKMATERRFQAFLQ